MKTFGFWANQERSVVNRSDFQGAVHSRLDESGVQNRKFMKFQVLDVDFSPNFIPSKFIRWQRGKSS